MKYTEIEQMLLDSEIKVIRATKKLQVALDIHRGLVTQCTNIALPQRVQKQNGSARQANKSKHTTRR